MGGLTVQQENAVLALLNEASVPKAAAACGVPERTLYRWLEHPTFLAKFRQARKKTFDQAISLTLRFSPMAVNVLAKVMTDPVTAAAPKVAAAIALLKFGRESIEMGDVVERLEELEADHAGGGGRRAVAGFEID